MFDLKRENQKLRKENHLVSMRCEELEERLEKLEQLINNKQ
jgi:hypothetical protein